MRSAIGQIALWLACSFAFVQSGCGIVAGVYGQRLCQEICRQVSFLHFGCIVIAFFTLLSGHLACDFSMLNVFLNNHTQMPWPYRFAALWGSHDGSMVLWSLILASMGAVFAYFRYAPRFSSLTLGVHGGISALFLLFLGIWCGPFDQILLPPTQGLGLNPLLQDRSLMIHPPLLYLGYGGFVMPFAMAVATLILPKKSWSQRVYPWTLFAWSFLTLGIGWGSWWAYYELGWGGWWFWDPVENLALMPWLTSAALFHTLKITQKKGALNRWSLFLALLTFSLCLLGTFLVRAGLLSSVHSFAYDLEKGVILSVIFALISGPAFAFWGWRLGYPWPWPKIFWPSRAGGLLIGAVFFLGAMGVVALGTLAPLVSDKLFVSPAYFINVLLLLCVMPLALMPLIPFLPWQREKDLSQACASLAIAGTITLGGVWSIWSLWDYPSFTAAVGVVLGLWVASGALSLFQKPHKPYGAILAHLGFACCLLGVTAGSYWRVEVEKVVAQGDRIEVGPYVLKLVTVNLTEGPNFHASRARVEVEKNGQFVTHLTPERRLYHPQEVLLSETAIYTTAFSDLYLVLGAYFKEERWQIKGIYYPFVPWIWLGGVLMFAGGIGALTQRLWRRSLGRQWGCCSTEKTQEDMRKEAIISFRFSAWGTSRSRSNS